MPEPIRLPWWPKFKLWLTSAVDRGDWPATDEYWSELERHVAHAGPAADVTLESCQEAARRLARKGFPYPSDLPRALPEELQAVFRAASSGPMDRADAERLSAGCPECCGQGLTSRVLPETGRSASCYCHRCPMGRWVQARHRSDFPDVARRIVDLRSRPDLTADDAEYAEADLDPPAPEEVAGYLRHLAAKAYRKVEPAPVASPRRGPAPNVYSLPTDRDPASEPRP